MDYLIPTINKDRTGFIPRPGTPDRSLRWLKDASGKQGAPAKDVAELSWYSFRVFMPDCAFQAHIPRDQRQCLGNWFKESTADVYTREKRHVVCSIWDQVLQKLPSMQLEAGRAVRVDLGHEDWEDKVECPASPKALFKEVPDTPSNASWDVIPADKPAITKVAADEVPPPRGPLTVIATTARKGPTKAYRDCPAPLGSSPQQLMGVELMPSPTDGSHQLPIPTDELVVGEVFLPHMPWGPAVASQGPRLLGCGPWGVPGRASQGPRHLRPLPLPSCLEARGGSVSGCALHPSLNFREDDRLLV